MGYPQIKGTLTQIESSPTNKSSEDTDDLERPEDTELSLTFK
ncbi:hypothetical protein H9L39_10342, partial [Fusarium oxysporum f. sp. albedinis]